MAGDTATLRTKADMNLASAQTLTHLAWRLRDMLVDAPDPTASAPEALPATTIDGILERTYGQMRVVTEVIEYLLARVGSEQEHANKPSASYR